MSHSLFLSPLHSWYQDNVDDPSQAVVANRFLGYEQYNVLYQKVEQYALDLAETRNLTFINYADTEWVYLIFKVQGYARVNTTGVDHDGTTPITGKLPTYGNRIIPGILILSTYNVQSFTVESLADDTTIEVYAAIAAADNDPRLDD